jgi:hypothetical protein
MYTAGKGWGKRGKRGAGNLFHISNFFKDLPKVLVYYFRIPQSRL